MRTEDTYFYDPVKGHGLPHDPFKAIVAPRPIGWISTRNPAGQGNLAPYSFFSAMCDHPPVIAFSSAGRKDSVRNIEATGEFVANFVSQSLAAAMNACSASFPYGEDEMVAVGLTPAVCRQVAAARVAEAPAALECRLLQIVALNDLDGQSTDHFVVFGQVTGVHIARAYLKDGRFDTGAAAPLMRAGYLTEYAAVGPEQILHLERPDTPDDARKLLAAWKSTDQRSKSL
jgi:flavin reductase (DIM6/NTAB) family NADH-FMN oxidoreductase RutF